MTIRELKLYPDETDYGKPYNDVWDLWEGERLDNTDLGVVAVVDRDIKHNTCMKREDCELTKGGIMTVPEVYRNLEPLTKNTEEISTIYIMRYQDNCDNTKCTRAHRTRLGCLQIDISSAVKDGSTWTLKSKVSVFTTVTMVLEVDGGIFIVEDGSGHLKEQGLYPAEAIWVCDECKLKF
tara:strand:+ start:102 stop:641 length:540 start_codon:yes stop_codon:yes gene_type:complete